MCNSCDILYKQRHSLAHILAQAVQREIQADVEVGIWPAIETWFYYDFLFSEEKQVKEEDLKKIQKQMEKIVKEGQDFVLIQANNQDATEIIQNLMWQQYKNDLMQWFMKDGENITFYVNTIVAAAKDNVLRGINPEYLSYYEKVTDFLQKKYPDKFQDKFVTFLDMCEGPHMESTKQIDIKQFKLDKLAGAYWKWDENNVMMTRVYAHAFENKQKLQEYLNFLEEAKKRDHRILGKKLWLYTFDDEVWPWLPLWLPNWAIIAEELETLAKQKEREQWYSIVRSPHIAKDKLYLRSGHLPYYKEDMFPTMELDGERYVLKAMNCPHHHKIYGAEPKSYRDLPIRYAEYWHCYRYEDSWALFGLMRVRSLCMNDAHIYCTEEQFEEEFVKVIELYKFYFKLFGIEKYQMRLSKHSKEGLGKKYIDNEELWIKTEWWIRDLLVKYEIPFVEADGEWAFYGPKIDVQIWSAIWREFTLATNQVDFAVPERFNLTYTDKNWEDKTPICIHRAPLSTHERMIWFLIEHFAGAFPVWLAPTQVKVIPVAETFNDYAQDIKNKIQSFNIRAKVDTSSDSFSKKIRNWELEKIPYLLIVWQQEVDNSSVNCRSYKDKKQEEMKVGIFIDKIVKEKECRSL